MNIIDAIKSGKRFKRKTEKVFLTSKAIGDITISSNYGICVTDLLADDWEVEEEKIEITASQILRAVAEASKKKAGMRGNTLSIHTPYGQDSISSAYGMDLIREEIKYFLEELGFKP